MLVLYFFFGSTKRIEEKNGENVLRFATRNISAQTAREEEEANLRREGAMMTLKESAVPA